MHVRAVALAIALASVVAACGSTVTEPSGTPGPLASDPGASTASGSSAPVSSPAEVASPTVEPTLAVLTLKQAGSAYAAVAKVYNQAENRAFNRYGKKNSLSAQRKYWAAVAKAEGAFIEGIKAIAFPAEVQPDVDALIKACVVARRRELTAAKQTTIAGLISAARKADTAAEKSSDMAALVRDALGLRSNS